MNQNQDIGLDVLNDCITAMNIDAKWSIRQTRSFTWWGFDLAQTIWVDEPEEDLDLQFVRINAKTDLWRDVSGNPNFDKFLNTLNMQASLNGLIYEKKESTVSLYCSAVIHKKNSFFMLPIFKIASSIQAADSLIKANFPTEKYPGIQMVRNSSGHPKSGIRDHYDDITEVIKELVRPHGEKESPFCETDFTSLKNMDPNPSIMTNAGETEVTAEFPVMEHGPSSVNATMGDFTYSPGTALFQATSKELHPQLGSGCFIKVILPTEENNADIANSLNFLEMAGDNGTHSLGTWCSGPEGVTYISFLPTLIYRPHLLNGLFHNYSAKAQWATNLILQMYGE